MRTITGLLLTILISLDMQLISARRRGKRTDIQFESDTDIQKYLQRRGRDMMIFRCKKVVMVQWLHSVIPYVDLECEILGEVTGVSWYFNDTLIDTGNRRGRFISLSQRHYRKRTFFNSWFDYKLRMLHVTEADNGPYTLKISSPDGYVQHRDIMLEVITDYREDKWLKWMDNVKKDRKKQRSRRRTQKLRKRELIRKLRQRAAKRKKLEDNPLIFDD